MTIGVPSPIKRYWGNLYGAEMVKWNPVHAAVADTGGIIFEVKNGGYQPVAADDYAHWLQRKETRNHGVCGSGMRSAGGRRTFAV